MVKTDKSGKITLIKREKYLELGKRQNTNDKKISREELRVIERKINEHTKMWLKVLNAGETHGHFSRIKSSKTIVSETAAPKYFMYKDHKSGGGYRPVVSGCSSDIPRVKWTFV